MTINRNDPRWTAYVLNEMGATERDAFEREMAADPESEVILAEFRETVHLLEDTLSAAPPVELSQTQKQEIHAAASPTSGNYRTWTVASGIAAALLVGFVSLLIVPDLLRSPDTEESASFQSPAVVGGSDLPQDPTTQVAQEFADARERDAEPVRELQQFAQTVREDANEAAEPAGAAGPAEPPSLAGRVTDSTGARIPGVAVTVTSGETGLAKTAVTDAAGEYRIDDLERGPAELRAELPGFETAVRDGFELADNARLDVSMDVAGATTEVEVVADAIEILAASSATVGAISEAEAFSQVSGSMQFAPRAMRAPAAAPVPAPASPPVAGAGADAASRGRFNTEEYDRIVDNAFIAVSQDPLATFSADVDTASYANVRRFLNQRTLPPPDAVRIEELINYFTYDYAPPTDNRPVRVHAEVAAAPWAPEHRLVRIGIKGREIDMDDRASTNLVFLIDVSGSMDSPDKLPLLKEGMKLLVEQLEENDRVAIVVYAGASGLVLPSTSGDRTRTILRALDRLSAGGSTNGGAGIQLAYDTAVANFIEGGVNRVILATDGDFNVGVTNNGDLTRLIEERAESGVFLSVLGFGTGNYNDAGLEALADQGNGNYAYIDGIREARKVLVEEMGSTLVTIAKDVKLQVEFNPTEVTAYRLIGYENRILQDQDFNDDTRDAGEIGAGHTVTALFEVVPAGVEIDISGVDPLRYQTPFEPTDRAGSGELLTVSIRYKDPDGDDSRLMEVPVRDVERNLEAASTDYRFQTAVAAFGMVLRDSPYKGSASFDSVLEIAEGSRGQDREGYREEFIDLVRRARAIRDLER